MTMPEGRAADGTWIASTEAKRDAIGSNEGLQVGHRCLTQTGDAGHSDNEIDVCESVDGANASTWSRKRIYFFHSLLSSPPDANISYLNWPDTARRTSITHANGTETVMGHAGRFLAMAIHCDLDPGSTAVGFHTGGSSVLIDSGTGDPGAADTPIRIAYTSLAVFTATQSVSVSINPTDTPGAIQWQVEVELDLLT